MLSKWNLGLWHKAIKQKCEVNCVRLHQVEPRHTSQTCPLCGNVDKRNRDGTLFRCIACGYESNADLNASINILNRFCQERVNLSSDIVPDMAKTDFIIFHWNWQLFIYLTIRNISWVINHTYYVKIVLYYGLATIVV